jgi:hypothetical protein
MHYAPEFTLEAVLAQAHQDQRHAKPVSKSLGYCAHRGSAF